MATGSTQSPLSFYSSDISTVSSGSTHGTDSAVLSCQKADWAYIQVYFTGATPTNTDTVDFNFLGRGHSEQSWPTVTSFSIQATANGTATVRHGEIIQTPYSDLKITSVDNNDATYDINAVNAELTYKY